MDHFLLPAHSTIPKSRVPYVCAEPYDGGPFSTYGERKGKEWLTIRGEQQDQLDVLIREGLRPTPTQEQESLFQTWLFFGLLQTVLGSIYKQDDYLYTEDGGSFVTTRQLIPHIDHALRIRDKSNTSMKREALESTAKCLRIVTVLLSTVQSDFDWRIRLSIASVCELLSTAVIAGYQALDLDSSHLSAIRPPSLPFSKETKACMLRAGWCPSDIATVAHKFQSLQTLHLLSSIDKSELARDHSQCTTRLCRYYQIRPEEYASKHRDLGCRCRDVGVDKESVIRIIEAGHLPLLKISGSKDSVNIEIVQSTPTTAYVALSHVWADGMGNPHANSLPACQLAYLGQMARKLRTKIAEYETPSRQEQSVPAKILSSFASLFRKQPSVEAVGAATEPQAESEPEPVLIWLDTLCCPVSPLEVKRLAISRMRETYLEAAHVLVLDAGCHCVALRDIESHEAVIRVITSGWTTRLWTLQEGVLARKLWFQFHDGPEDVLNLFVWLFQEYKDDFRKRCIFNDMYKDDWSSMFRTFQLDKKPLPSRGVGLDLVSLDRALQGRSCSVASDEAICISTMLGLSLEELLHPTVSATAEARMAKVWDMVARKYGGLPQGIVGLDFPRLSVKGYEWAPRTLLSESESDASLEGPTNPVTVRIPIWTNPTLCTLTTSGLVVKCPGFLLKPRTYHDDLGRNPWSFFQRKVPETVVPFRGDDGLLYGLALLDTPDDAPPSPSNQYPLHDIVSSGACALLRIGDGREPSSDALQPWQGLVCDIVDPFPPTHAPENPPKWISLANYRRVVVQNLSLTPAWAALYSAAETIALRLRASPLTDRIRMLRSQGSEEEFNGAVNALQASIDDTAKALVFEPDSDGELLRGLQMMFGELDAEKAWKGLPLVIKEWFWGDFVGAKTVEAQAWCLQ